MLLSLTINNYALIQHLEFAPGAGMTVITGETGAGKSIIMGALGMVLGGRAEAKSVGDGAQKCVIEATFDVSRYALRLMFEELDLDYEDETLIRREVSASGKSRAFVNDVPVSLTVLKQLGERLIDIHSQHQNLLLGSDRFQMEVLDALAYNDRQVAAYTTCYRQLTDCRKRLKEARDIAARAAKDADYIRFQLAQLEDARLQEGELAELEQEQELLAHAEEIKEGLSEVCEILNGDGESILTALKLVLHKAREVSRVYPDMADFAERLESDYIDLKDIAVDVEDRQEGVNYDPERLGMVEERLSMLYSLLKKHNVETVEELIGLRDSLAEQMSHIDNSDEEIAELEAEEKHLLDEAQKAAKDLTQTRAEAALRLETELVAKVVLLGMPNVRFVVQIEDCELSATGKDSITFMFSANKNQPLCPVGNVASGGEISRIMLCIKAMVASAKTLPTIIFDEIDTGVSGDIADAMGGLMQELAQHLQVITITHLPQVAGKGTHHYRVYKTDDVDATHTHIEALNDENRLNEVARMLSGANITQEALANARMLISGK